MAATKDFLSLIKAGTPEAEILAWMKTLSDVERQEIQDAILDIAARIIALVSTGNST